MVGKKLADKYGWNLSAVIPIKGTIYPGTWTFTIHGIWIGGERQHRRKPVAVLLSLHLLGGFVPARRVARLKIVDCLRVA